MQVEKVCQYTKIANYTNTVIYKKGSPPDSLVFVLEGELLSNGKSIAGKMNVWGD